MFYFQYILILLNCRARARSQDGLSGGAKQEEFITLRPYSTAYEEMLYNAVADLGLFSGLRPPKFCDFSIFYVVNIFGNVCVT